LAEFFYTICQESQGIDQIKVSITCLGVVEIVLLLYYLLLKMDKKQYVYVEKIQFNFILWLQILIKKSCFKRGATQFILYKFNLYVTITTK